MQSVGCSVGGSRSEAGLRARVLLVLVAATLAGCGSTVSQMPVIGMPANAPPPPAQNRGYLPVNDLPGARDEAPLNVSQQVTLEQELSALRAKQKAAAAADAAAIAASPTPELGSRTRAR